ncbi:C40 family peptidase [Amycolatopsis sp. CA-161197]|uniref:C40 family peptidase n=1 Tax=Amycolatopsis sp. CA-161197 TaxID=3239922 RepID=UPI003D936E7E
MAGLNGIAAVVLSAVVVVGLPAAAVAVTVLAPESTSATVALTGCIDGGPGGGGQEIDRQVLDADSMDIARTIVDVVRQRQLPRRAAVLALATALVESGLRNLDHGDRDSLGVFQQRPSQGWGTRAQILDPVYATNAFLDHLVAVPGWATMPPGKAEQAVQNSGFPERYAPREQQATDIVAKFWTGPDNPVPAPGATEPVAATPGCPDHGSSDLPLPPGKRAQTVPPGFTLPADAREAAAVSFTVAQLGKPYEWGGKGPDSYDCSGLVLAAWAAAGVAVPAGTLSQVRAGHAIADGGDVLPGDLLFIPGALGTAAVPRHVGIFIGHGLVVDAYDEQHGVILSPLTSWTGRIVAIRRVVDPTTPSPTPGGS